MTSSTNRPKRTRPTNTPSLPIPSCFRAYVTLARLCIKTKDWNCAGKTADALIKVDPKHSYPEIYLHQAVARYELKDLNGAQESVQESMRLDPKLAAERRVCAGTDSGGQGRSGRSEGAHGRSMLQFEPAPPDIELVRGHIDNLGKPQANDVDPPLEPL